MGSQRECTRILGLDGFRVQALHWETDGPRAGSAFGSSGKVCADTNVRDVDGAPGAYGIALSYGKSPAQIVLRWNVQQGVIPISSSTERSHIAANLDVFDFHLAAEDMRAIDQLDQPASQRR